MSGIAKAVGQTIENVAKMGATTTKLGVSSIETADTAVQFVKGVVGSGEKATQMVQASQDLAIEAITESKDIVKGTIGLSTESIKLLTEQTKNANVLTTEGLKTVTASMCILNQLLSDNKDTLVKLFGAPITAANTAIKGINALLQIIFLSPLQTIMRKLDERKKQKELENETRQNLAKKRQEYETKLGEQKLDIEYRLKSEEAKIDANKQLELLNNDSNDKHQTDALQELAKAAHEKQKELDNYLKEKIENVSTIKGGEGEPTENIVKEALRNIANNPDNIEKIDEFREDMGEKQIINDDNNNKSSGGKKRIQNRKLKKSTRSKKMKKTKTRKRLLHN